MCWMVDVAGSNQHTFFPFQQNCVVVHTRERKSKNTVERAHNEKQDNFFWIEEEPGF